MVRSIAARPATIALLLAYEGFVALWIYHGLRTAEGGMIGVGVGVATAVLGFALGLYGRSWWLVLAPVAAPFFAIPAGDYPGREIPVWYVAALALPTLALEIAAGIGSIKLFRRYSARRRRVP